MNDCIERLGVILKMNSRELLTHAGKISHQMALETLDYRGKVKAGFGVKYKRVYLLFNI